jgi:hypothetical protein
LGEDSVKISEKSVSNKAGERIILNERMVLKRINGILKAEAE